MLNLKITPNVNNNSDFYIFFCEKNFSFNSKKLSFLDINNKEINSILLKKILFDEVIKRFVISFVFSFFLKIVLYFLKEYFFKKHPKKKLK